MSDERAEMLVKLNQAFTEFVPHNAALGMRLIDYEPGVAVIEIPYSLELVGHPDTGVLHGGVVTSLIDATSGAAVYMKLGQPVPIATLDLRIDYLKPAAPGRPLIARATCYRLTHNVGFTRAIAYNDDPDDPIASSAGAFMIATKGAAAIRMKAAP